MPASLEATACESEEKEEGERETVIAELPTGGERIYAASFAAGAELLLRRIIKVRCLPLLHSRRKIERGKWTNYKVSDPLDSLDSNPL